VVPLFTAEHVRAAVPPGRAVDAAREAFLAYARGVGFDCVVELGRTPRVVVAATGAAARLPAGALARALAGDAARLAAALGGPS